jgi:hypothetical protein
LQRRDSGDCSIEKSPRRLCGAGFDLSDDELMSLICPTAQVFCGMSYRLGPTQLSGPGAISLIAGAKCRMSSG